jgi:hypothetical protein
MGPPSTSKITAAPLQDRRVLKMNNSVDIVYVPAAQDDRSWSMPHIEPYRAFASNLKRATALGKVLGSVDLFLPSFDLHVHCRWLRDERGNERIGLPRIKVETPDGKIHHKTLARWGTSQSEERFQRAALAALHQLISNTQRGGI